MVFLGNAPLQLYKGICPDPVLFWIFMCEVGVKYVEYLRTCSMCEVVEGPRARLMCKIGVDYAEDPRACYMGEVGVDYVEDPRARLMCEIGVDYVEDPRARYMCEIGVDYVEDPRACRSNALHVECSY
ncbi:hypothetical protein ACFE04_017104 [Oxalis oulophora]